MDETTKAVNAHREALGYQPLESADKRELVLVELCAQYGMDRWEPGILKGVFRGTTNADLVELLEADPDREHDDLHEPDGAFAEVWREAGRRGLAIGSV